MQYDDLPARVDEADAPSLIDTALPLARNLKLLVAMPLLAGLAALGLTYVVPPTFTARTSFLPPQQQQSAAASALASLGALAGLGGLAGAKSPAEQYVALLQSTTVADRLVDRFGLIAVYDEELRQDARKTLWENVRIAVGKKDGLVSIEVDDKDAKRAAELANAHVDELRRLTSSLAIGEAQQRRVFFEQQLGVTRDALTQAQLALQASGFTSGALKAEPRAAAEDYARLRAETTAADVRLQALRRSFADDTPEVQQQQATAGALRAQLQRLEQAAGAAGSDPGYVAKYRELKYQEALFDVFARQYELARVDEAREGALIQVVDAAAPPERKSRPKRAYIAVGTTVAVFVMLVAWLLARQRWRDAADDPRTADKVQRLRTALRRRS